MSDTGLENHADVVVLIAADAEWQAVLAFHRKPVVSITPFGSTFRIQLGHRDVVLFHCGWGKIAAAAGTQYAISAWHPRLVINIGTCGGISDQVQSGEIILANETLVYDIYERMGDAAQALDYYRTPIDLSFLCAPFPQKVRAGRLVSADQDIDPDLVFKLKDELHAVAADWESGAIAWTAQRNATPVLILRGVSDLVSPLGGEIYASREFAQRAAEVMQTLLKALPNWIRCAFWGNNP